MRGLFQQPEKEAFFPMMQYRWAQMDLGSQMESPDFIRRYMDQAAKAGYNGIFLSLAGRVRTASFPYPSDGQCYTEEELRGMVDHARGLGLEVVPCVPTLGHVGQFLKFPQLAPLAEVQGEMKGRFGWGVRDSYCPTHPRLYEFLLPYLREVARIFPGPFFHVGLDEFWDYCLCPRCREKAPDLAGQAALFAEHVERLRQCLKECGKTMMMWSDMFEYYPEAQERISREVVLVDWQYQEDVRRYVHHLFDAFSEDRLALNGKMGFTTFIAPAEMTYRNGESYLACAQGKGVQGFINTCWLKYDTSLLRTLPTIIYNGYLLQGLAPAEATGRMMEQLFGTRDPLLASGVTLALTMGPPLHFKAWEKNALFSRDFRGLSTEEREEAATALEMLRQRCGLVQEGLGREILLDLMDAMEEQTIVDDLRKGIHAALDGRPLQEEALRQAQGRLACLLDRLAARWDRWRGGLSAWKNSFRENRERLLGGVSQALAELKECRFVRLRLCVPDGYVVEKVGVSLQFSSQGSWRRIFHGGAKPQDLNHALAEFFLPYRPQAGEGRPVAVKLEASGMGGVGFCHVLADGCAPRAIREVMGMVQNPEHLLVDNVNFAWAGSQSTREAYFHPAQAEAIHGVVLEVAPPEECGRP